MNGRRLGVSLPSVAGRARADRWPLLLVTAVVTLAAFLATAIPRLVQDRGDEAVRHAVVAAGASAEVSVSIPLEADPYAVPTLRPDLALTAAIMTQLLAESLVPMLAEVLDEPVATSVTSSLTVMNGPQGLTDPMLRMGHLWRSGPPALTWIDGGPAKAAFTDADLAAWLDGSDGVVGFHLPAVPVEVGLSEAVADVLQVGVGDVISARNEVGSVFVDAVVSGIFRPDDPTDPLWSHLPSVLEPRIAGSALTRSTQVTGLLSDESLPAAVVAMPVGTTTRTITFAPDVGAIRQDVAVAVAAELAGLESSAQSQFGYATLTGFRTSLDVVLLDSHAQFGAATAQASVLLAGVLTVALCTLVVAATLLVQRRARVLATHRARGATLIGIAAELAVESVLVAGIGCGLGVVLAGVAVPGPLPWTWLVPVAGVAVLGTPVLGARLAARSTGGRQVAANRLERAMADKDRHAGRLAVEAAVLLAAAGALAALRTRGVTGSAEPDPLLALAPTLGALAGAVLLLRALPPLLRWAVAVATRWKRAVPVLAAARAQATAGAALPFLALTTATSLGVLGVALVGTVHEGEVDASWRAVGADVAIVSAPDQGLAEVAADLRTGDGVATAVTGRVEEHVEVFGPWGGRLVRLVVLPVEEFEALLATTPLPDAPELRDLVQAAPAASTPVLLSAGLRQADDTDLSLLWNGTHLDVTAVGTAPALLGGDVDTVVVDGATLAAALGTDIDPNRLSATGRGAEAAVAASAIDSATVTTRADWLAAHRTEPLVVGVVQLSAAAALVLLVLVVLVVVLASATSAPHRGVTLATLRTLGLDGHGARTITAGELLPGVLVASVGGVGLGAVLATAATGPLSLHLVTGQPVDPRTVLTAWIAVPPVVVLATVAVLVLLESSLHRRERLGEILRVGGS